MTKLLLFAALAAVAWWLMRRAMTIKPTKPLMPRDEAARFLGVASDADAAAINEAHRRLIAKVHPDVGGNAELAARINMARDTMLKL
jgi:hypothetical protein